MFKKILAMLLALILALPASALAEAAPAGNAAAMQGAEEAVEAPLEALEGALEGAQPELLPEAEPEPLPEGDIEPLPEPDSQPEAPREPDEAEAEIQPEASLGVRVEVDELLMLHARIEGDTPAGLACQWQAAERAALLEARQTGADEEPLWSDIEGAQGEVLDVQAAFREAFADYSYRCLVRAGESSATSEPYSFQAERVEASVEAEPGEEGEPSEEAEAGVEAESVEEAGEAVEAHPLFASEASELRFAESPVKIGKGERYTPALIGLPEGAQGVSYKSSKPKIFSVNPDTGEIEGLKTGKGKLTVTYGPSSASVTVQVCAAPKKFRLEPAELELGVGEFAAPEVVPSPKSAFGHVKSWRSGDEAVAAVEDGKLRAVAPGETDVTAVLYNDLEFACKVTVREAPSAEGMALTLPEGSEDGVIGVGQTVQLGVRYENAAGSVEFRSEQEAVAAVDAQGKLKGVAPGKAVIVARAYNGVEASLEITVKAKPTKLALLNAPKTLGIGEPWTLEVKLSNKAGDDCGGAVTFRSSKPGVLDVDPHTGALTAKKTGSAKITATTYNKLKKSATIAVKQAPTGFTLSASELEIGMGQKGAKLTVTNAGKKQFGNVLWENENPDVVALSAKGALTPLAPGSSRITATVYNSASPDEPFVQICDVTVKQKPEKGGVRLVFLDSEGRERSTIGVGESIAPSIVCANGGGGGFTLSSSKKSVATASKSGVVKGKKKGKAKITAKTYNNVKASATMQVVPGPALVRYTYYPGNPMPKGTRYKLRVMMVDKDYNELERMSHTFESSNPDIVSVDPVTGVLTAVSDSGNAKITARAYNGVEAVIYVFATKAPDEGEGGGSTANPTIQMTQSELTLKPGDTAELDVKTTGLSYLTGADVYWASDDSSVATVSWGHVKAVGPGTTRVTASVEGPSGPLTAACRVTVTDASGNTPTPGATTPTPGGTTPEPGSSTEPGDNTPEPGSSTEPGDNTPEPGSSTEPGDNTPNPGDNTPEPGEEQHPSISLSQSQLELEKGDTAQLTATLTDLPGVTQADISWDSADSSVATVSGGLVSGVAPGSTKITASVQGPSGLLTAECAVTVTEAGEPALRLSDSEVSLVEGRTMLLGVTLEHMPSVAQSSVSWSSDARTVATVSGGKITAVAPGEANITASARYDGASYSASCRVTVTQASYAIQLSPETLNLYVYDEADIAASLIDMPETTPQKLTWSTSKSSVASVQAGHVVAKSAGEAEITAKLTYYNKTVSAICAVTVQDAPPSLKLNPEQASLYVGDSLTLTAKPRSMNKPGTVTWRSDAEGIARVEDGVVYAVAPGSADITASVTDTLEDGSEQVYSATCKISVSKYPPEIRLNPSELELREGESASIEATLIGMSPDTQIRWSANSQNVSVEGGLVQALAEGEAEITASATDADGDSASATCHVSVLPDVTLQLSAEQLRLKPGEEAQLTASFTGSASDAEPQVSWEIDSAIASISGGTVRANSEGRAQITAKAAHPSKPGVTLQASCALTVTSNRNAATRLESAELEEDSGRVELRWELSGADSYGIYEVVGGIEILRGVVSDGDVYLYGVGGGTHTYVVRPRNLVGMEWVEGEASAPITVEVPEWRTPPEPKPAEDAGEGSVKLSWSEVPGAQGYVIYEVPEESGAPRQVMQVSGASVELAGVEPGWHSYSVAAIVPGAANSRAATGPLGNLSRPMGVFVEGWIVLDKQEIHTHYGDKVQLIPSIHMPAGGNPKVTWTSSNEEAATVDENGWVTTLLGDYYTDGGRTTITASVAGGYYTAKCEVYVKSVRQEIGDYVVIDDILKEYNGDQTDIVVPYGVKRIASKLFWRGPAYSPCHITSVIMPSTVTSIGGYAFGDCSKLEKVTLSKNLEVIEGYAFNGCTSLASLSLPYGLKRIGEYAFGACAFSTLQIPETVTSMGHDVFSNCKNLTSLTIPDTVTELGDALFWGCENLQSTTFPAKITEIPDFMYYGCKSLKSVEIPDYITKIGKAAFEGCVNLTSVSIPASVTDLGAAFIDCNALTHVEIPDSVQTIGDGTFNGCTALQSVQLPTGLKEISYGLFNSCKNLTSVTIPNGVTEIYTNAFNDCKSLTSITVPDSVAYIWRDAFDSNTTIYCSAGSYAEQWAIDNKIPYSTTGTIAPGGDFTIGTGMTLDMKPMLGDKNTSQGYWTENQEIAEFNGSGVLTGITAGTVRVADIMQHHSYTVHVVGFQVAQEQIPVLGTINRQPVDISGEWSSSNPQIAGVDQSGNVTGYQTGTATITVTRDENLWASYTVEVVAGADEILTDPGYLLLAPGEGAQIHLKAPSGQLPPVATYISSDEQIASVDADGYVTAKGYGRTRITAQAIEGSGVAVCDVVVVRDTDGEEANNQVGRIITSADLLLKGHAAFDGGYTNSSGERVLIDLDDAMEAAMALYKGLKGEDFGIDLDAITDGMYLAEKLLSQASYLPDNAQGSSKQAYDVFFGAVGFSNTALDALNKLFNTSAFSASGGQLNNLDFFENWFEKNGDAVPLTGLFKDMGKQIKDTQRFLTLINGYFKYQCYIAVDREKIKPVFTQLRASNNQTLRIAGGLIDYITLSEKNAARYVLSTVGAKQAEKEFIGAAKVFGLGVLKAVPTVGWVFFALNVGKDVGYAVSDLMFNASKLSTAAFNLKKAIAAAKAYKSTFEKCYEAFKENPASLERMLAFHDALQTFGALVKAEYSEYEDFVSKYSDAALTRLEGLISDARKNAKEQVATLKDLGRIYNTATMNDLIEFRKNCDGKDF